MRVLQLKADRFVDNRRACDCYIYIVISVLYCMLVDSLCCKTFVFDSYDDVCSNGCGFDGHELLR